MDLLVWFTDLALSVNPSLPDQKHAQSVTGRIQIISKPALDKNTNPKNVHHPELPQQQDKK